MPEKPRPAKNGAARHHRPTDPWSLVFPLAAFVYVREVDGDA